MDNYKVVLPLVLLLVCTAFLWLRGKIRDRQLQNASGPLHALALAVVQQYQSVLQAFINSGDVAWDAGRLPASKDALKAAIKLCLQRTDDDEQREALKIRYVELAKFQEGVGQAGVKDAMSELSGLNVDEFHDRLSEGAGDLDRTNQWLTIVATESVVLLKELES